MSELLAGYTNDTPNSLKEALERKREEDHIRREGLIHRYGSESATEAKLAEEARQREQRAYGR